MFNRTFKNISQILGALCHRGATEEDGLKNRGEAERRDGERGGDKTGEIRRGRS